MKNEEVLMEYFVLDATERLHMCKNIEESGKKSVLFGFQPLFCSHPEGSK
jgi:hypothetical protein